MLLKRAHFNQTQVKFTLVNNAVMLQKEGALCVWSKQSQWQGALEMQLEA